MNIHRHWASVKLPWFERALSLIQGKPGTRERWWFPIHRPGLCWQLFVPGRSSSEKRYNKKQVWIIPAQDISSPSSPCPTAAPALPELCGAPSWAAPACSGQNQNQLITRESCQHTRLSANIQAIFLMNFFWCHKRRMKDLTPPWSSVYLTLGSAAIEMLKLQVGRQRHLL